MNHKLIINGLMKAQCSCGEWQYVGIMPEASKAIKKVHMYHATFGRVVKKKKKR